MSDNLGCLRKELLKAKRFPSEVMNVAKYACQQIFSVDQKFTTFFNLLLIKKKSFQKMRLDHGETFLVPMNTITTLAISETITTVATFSFYVLKTHCHTVRS